MRNFNPELAQCWLNIYNAYPWLHLGSTPRDVCSRGFWQNRSDTTVHSDGDTTDWHNWSKWHDRLMVIRLVDRLLFPLESVSTGNPTNTRRCINVVLMLGHRLRRRPNITTTLVYNVPCLPGMCVQATICIRHWPFHWSVESHLVNQS